MVVQSYVYCVRLEFVISSACWWGCTWCASRLVRLICSQIILSVSSHGSGQQAVHLPFVSYSYHPCVQVEWGQTSLVRLGPLGPHWPIGYVSYISQETADVLVPVVQCLSGLFDWVISLLAKDRPMAPQFRKVHRPPLLPITDGFPLHKYFLRF